MAINLEKLFDDVRNDVRNITVFDYRRYPIVKDSYISPKNNILVEKSSDLNFKLKIH